MKEVKCVICGKAIPFEIVYGVGKQASDIGFVREVCDDCRKPNVCTGIKREIPKDCFSNAAQLAGEIVQLAMKEYETTFLDAVKGYCQHRNSEAEEVQAFWRCHKMLGHKYYGKLSMNNMEGVRRSYTIRMMKTMDEQTRKLAGEMLGKLEIMV